MGSCGVLGRGCQKRLIKGFGLVQGDFREGFRKQGFAPHRVLSGSKRNFITSGHCNKSYL